MSVRFLLSRRWVLFGLAVVLAAYGAYLLGQWQFHRLDERRDRNAVISTNLAANPAPVGHVLSPGAPVAQSQEWRTVTATGTYDDSRTVTVRYQTRDGSSGVDLVTPLVTDSGTALLVDRGWTATDNVGAAPTDLPAPPSGTVTVTGWVRANASSDAARVTDGSTRAVSSREIGPTLPYDVFGGFVDAETQSPAPQNPLRPAEKPSLGDGPHFFYGLQWWFFGLLAVFGFGYFAFDEWRKKHAAHSDRSMPPSTGTIAPDTNDAAGESRKAATRPSSSGRP